MGNFTSKWDSRGSGDEGKYAEALYDKVLNFNEIPFVETTKLEDCKGADRIEGKGKNKRKTDVKGRKSAGPHKTWLEICASHEGAIGTGWSYHDVDIAQLMIYEEDGYITNIIFGKYYAPDAKENIIEKTDLTKTTRSSVELYKLYHRWSRYKSGNLEHRGATLCIKYSALEALSSFEAIAVPKELWEDVMNYYNKAAKQNRERIPYKGIK
jgi:hypothetical protein